MYIEFKLYAGRIPYFIEKHIPYVINSKYYGTAIQDDTNYIPDSITKLTKEQLETVLTNASLFKQVDSTNPMEPIFVEMTTAGKIALITEYLGDDQLVVTSWRVLKDTIITRMKDAGLLDNIIAMVGTLDAVDKFEWDNSIWFSNENPKIIGAVIACGGDPVKILAYDALA